MKKTASAITSALLLFLFLLAIQTAYAGSPENKPDHNNSIERLNKGSSHAGISMGPGFGVEMLGSGVKHDIFLVFASYGRVISDMRASSGWNRGNWEIVGEVFGGNQFQPEHSYVVGVDGLLRYNFLPFEPETPWTFFTDIGGGVSATDIGGPDLSNGFQFNIQLNAGTHYFITDNTAITLKAKAFHLSNAGLDHPNNGLNSFFLMLGLSWFF